MFNSEMTLGRMIHSVIPLLEEGAQIIFVDNLSRDQSLGLAKALTRNYNSIFETCHSLGPGLARNHGMDLGDRKFVTFLDADDQLIPSAIVKLLRRMTDESFSVGRTSVEVVQSKSSDILQRRIIRPSLDCAEIYDLQKNVTGVHGVLYELDWLRKFQILFPSGFIAEDLAFNLQVAREGSCIVQIQDVGYRYFMGVNGQISRKQFSTKDIVLSLAPVRPSSEDNFKYRKAYWTTLLRTYVGAIGHANRGTLGMDLLGFPRFVPISFRDLPAVVVALVSLFWKSKLILVPYLKRLVTKNDVRLFMDAEDV